MLLIILQVCKHAVKKLSYQLRYVLDWHKTQQMCDKAILEDVGTLKSVPDCYKNQEICNKVFDNYPHALEFVHECYRNVWQSYWYLSLYNKICSWMP